VFDLEAEPAAGSFLDPSLLRLPGLELLRTYLEGTDRWAPIAHLTGMHLTHVDAGTATCVLPLSAWLDAGSGVVSPSALIIPTDSALGSAIHTTLPAATLYTTAELSMTWIRDVEPGGQVTAVGRCVHTSPTLALSTARVTDDDGALVAHATARCTVFPPVREVPDPVDPADAPAGDAAARRPDPYERPVDDDPGRPPVERLFGLTVAEAGDGVAMVSLPGVRWLCGPAGTLQGGVLAVVAHRAAQAAAETTVAPGGALAAVDLKVNLLRPAPPDGTALLARGRVLHRGRATVIAAAEVTNAGGQRVALLTASAVARPPAAP